MPCLAVVLWEGPPIRVTVPVQGSHIRDKLEAGAGPQLGSVWDRKHPEVGEGGRESCWVSAREVARLRPRVK